jgi:hypothetical protein
MADEDDYLASTLDGTAARLALMTAEVVRDPSITPPYVRAVLRFINGVVEAATIAFHDVYAVLIDVQFLQEDEDAAKRIVDIRRSLALLPGQRPIREAEEMWRRLEYLTEEYDRTIRPIVAHLESADHQFGWHGVWILIFAHESTIIYVVRSATDELEDMLSQLAESPDKAKFAKVSASARERAADFRSTLDSLERLRNRILGLSGEEGLMALVSGSEEERVAAAVTVEELRMGDTYHVQGAGAVGRGAFATNVNINQAWQNLENRDTELLARELAELRAELKTRASDAEHDLATGEVASAQLAAEKGDGPGAMAHLARVGKWALEIASSIGTTVAAAAIKAAIGI